MPTLPRCSQRAWDIDQRIRIVLSRHRTPRHMSKRSRTEFEADSTLKSSRKARRMTQKTPGKFVTYNVEQHQTPRPETPPQVSAGQSFAKLRAYMEVFRTPLPAPEPLQESPGSPSPAETSFQDPSANTNSCSTSSKTAQSYRR
jgi:hypothetical protein